MCTWVQMKMAEKAVCCCCESESSRKAGDGVNKTSSFLPFSVFTSSLPLLHRGSCLSLRANSVEHITLYYRLPTPDMFIFFVFVRFSPNSYLRPVPGSPVPLYLISRSHWNSTLTGHDRVKLRSLTTTMALQFVFGRVNPNGTEPSCNDSHEMKTGYDPSR